MRAADKPIHPEPTDEILGKLAKPEKERILTKVSFLVSLICGAWSKQEGKTLTLSFLSRFRLSGKKKEVIELFLSQREAITTWAILTVPENLAWKLLGGQGGSPKIWLTEMWVVSHFAAIKGYSTKLICKELYLNGLKTNKHLYKSSLLKIRELAQMLFKFMIRVLV